MKLTDMNGILQLHVAFYAFVARRGFTVRDSPAERQYRHMLETSKIGFGGSVATYAEKLVDIGMLVKVAENHFSLSELGGSWAAVIHLTDGYETLLLGMNLSPDEWHTLLNVTRLFADEMKKLQAEVADHLSDEHTTPHRLGAMLEAAGSIGNFPAFPTNVHPVQVYKQAVVLACREQMLRLHARAERLNVRARDRQVMEGANSELDTLARILERPQLADSLTTRKPRITDFVNVGVVEQHLRNRPTDEKFGILTAPHQFSTDFDETRDGAFARGRSFAVGFIDIDDFKIKFNNVYKETIVDRDILPTFMRALEAYCYRRAYAYRQGGDEYLVLLHNATADEARVFFEGLQTHLAAIEYPPCVKSNPTVSIGVHVIDDIHEVTEFEAKRRANLAKDAAKKAGKDNGKGLIRFWSDLTPEEQS